MLYPDGQNHTVKNCLQQVETASLFKWWCQVSSAKALQTRAVAGQEASEKRISIGVPPSESLGVISYSGQSTRSVSVPKGAVFRVKH